MMPVLTTERLTLRGPDAADFPLYRDFFAQATGPGTYGGPRRADDAFRVLAYDVGHWQLKGFGKWLLDVTATGQTIGGCGLVHPTGWPNAELTWWLMPQARGHGYAAEASRAALAHAYDTLGWDEVVTHMRDANTPARALAERLGGTIARRETFPDGVTRDVYRIPHPGGMSDNLSYERTTEELRKNSCGFSPNEASS